MLLLFSKDKGLNQFLYSYLALTIPASKGVRFAPAKDLRDKLKEIAGTSAAFA